MKKQKISDAVIHRLPRYYRYLDDLYNKGGVRISSNSLGAKMDITASQIRQDLSCFGEFGQQGYGYNVLALRGDKSQNEKRFMPHPQGHAHAVALVRQIADMNRGKFIDGEVEECHHSKFSIGVAGYPEVHAEARDITSDIARLRDKVDAGAEYVITQMFFDNAKYFDFVRRCREAGITVPIIPGIKPLSTLRHLEILPETFGVKLPEELVREVKAHPDGVREVGTEWAIAQSRELMAAGVPVLHYYTMSRTTNIQKIVKAVF